MSMSYTELGKKLIAVDELPQHAIPRYERDPASIAHIVCRRGAVSAQVIEGEEYIIKNCDRIPDHIIEREGFVPAFEVSDKEASNG